MSLDLTLAGQSVHRITLDYAVSLLLDGGVAIRIECAFSVQVPGGQVVIIEPEQLGPGIEHMVCVLHQSVTYAVAQDDGTLALGFGNGAKINVAAHEAFEAWTLAGPHGRKVVATPGGALGIWGAPP